MFVYILWFFLVFLIYSNNNRTNPKSKKVLALLIASLAVFVGLADMLGGYDRYVYGDLFDSLANDIRSDYGISNSAIMGYRSEIAYVYWNVLVAHVTQNRYMFILLTTILVYALLYKSMKDYLDDYALGVIMFLSLFFFFTFTYLRQVMATSVVWFSYRYVIQKKPFHFFVCALIAYKLHNSAIIFMPFYFLPLKKYSKRQIICFLMICLAIGTTGSINYIYSIYSSIDTVRAGGYELDDTGGRVAYLVEVVVFLYFILKRYELIREENRQDVVFMNAAICFCAILLVFFRNSNAGRQSWFFMIGVISILCRMLTTNASQAYFRNLMIVLFLLYMRIVIGWGHLLSPYKTFLTDGSRAYDPTMVKFEYDWNYEQDKFYRPMIDFYFK